MWQCRYWEPTIRDGVDFARHIDYVHINPVKHGLVDRGRDWASPLFHRRAKCGNYLADWAGDQSDDGHDYGKRRSDGFHKSSTHPTS